jgi:hypothetical protein
MQIRTTVLAAVASVVVLATAGIGLAGTRGDNDDTVSQSPSPSPTTTPIAGTTGVGLGERRVVAADPAGTVGYRFADVLTVTSVDPAPGWAAEIERPRGREIEVVFTNGARRIDVEVEIEDGAPRERVRDRTGDDRAADHDHDDERSGRDDHDCR